MKVKGNNFKDLESDKYRYRKQIGKKRLFLTDSVSDCYLPIQQEY